MHRLLDLIEPLTHIQGAIRSLEGDANCTVSMVAFDSRAVGEGAVFIAVKGTQTDGHQYIHKAIERGAKVIVCESLPPIIEKGITYVEVSNSAEALALICRAYYNYPDRNLKVVGVTGTNGKTSVATLLHSLFTEMGHSCGLVSTIVVKVGTQSFPATHTTPDPIQLYSTMQHMVQAGCTHCFMEVSSHALAQARVAGLAFHGGIFTNITHDHLDYHGTFANYLKAKKTLFDMLPQSAFALINADDKNSKVMVQNTAASVYTYGIKNPAQYKSKILEIQVEGMLLEIDNHQAWFRLTGHFNAWNITAVYATAVLLGEKPESILTALSSLPPVKGRFEVINLQGGACAVVDYAHTPDALRSTLETLHELRRSGGRIIVVVGCGGNRDTEKRPLMGAIATQFADLAVFTSDNPRNEDPESIIEAMYSGVPISNRRKVMRLVNRREAIQTVARLATPADIILIAGKGHETYQEANGERHAFDDAEIVKQAFNLIHG